jgi:hypothetical protein
VILIQKKVTSNEKTPFHNNEKVYLIEKINDSTIVKYDVKWQYYIN